jgi:Hint module
VNLRYVPVAQFLSSALPVFVVSFRCSLSYRPALTAFEHTPFFSAQAQIKLLPDRLKAAIPNPVSDDTGTRILGGAVGLNKNDLVSVAEITQCYAAKPYSLAASASSPFCPCLTSPPLGHAITAGQRLFSSGGRATFGIKPLVRENLRATLRDAALCYNLPEDEFLRGDPGDNGTSATLPPASSTPSPRPSVFNAPDLNPTCFPASARVMLEDGSFTRMDSLEVGDRVQVSATEFSDVFMFTHKSSHEGHQRFVAIEGASGARIRLTPSHYLYINGELAAAGAVSIGDEIELASGAMDRVTNVDFVMDVGLYNPQTLDGRIVVDGVLASAYTRAIDPRIAHAGLVVSRALYSVTGGWDSSMGTLSGELPRNAVRRLSAFLLAL